MVCSVIRSSIVACDARSIEAALGARKVYLRHICDHHSRGCSCRFSRVRLESAQSVALARDASASSCRPSGDPPDIASLSTARGPAAASGWVPRSFWVCRRHICSARHHSSQTTHLAHHLSRPRATAFDRLGWGMVPWDVPFDAAPHPSGRARGKWRCAAAGVGGPSVAHHAVRVPRSSLTGSWSRGQGNNGTSRGGCRPSTALSSPSSLMPMEGQGGREDGWSDVGCDASLACAQASAQSPPAAGEASGARRYQGMPSVCMSVEDRRPRGFGGGGRAAVNWLSSSGMWHVAVALTPTPVRPLGRDGQRI